MTTTTSTTPIILIPGHWLGAWAWDEVLEYLEINNPGAIAMTLPGLDDSDPERTKKTLDDQVAAILETFDQRGVCQEQPAVIVAHSGANAPVSIVLDQHPNLVQRVVWVDSGPVAPGSVFAPDLPDEVKDLPLPPFEVLAQQASLEGLSAEVLERFRHRAVPEPAPVLRQPVVLTHDARHRVRTTMVCCSMPSGQVRELARAGHPMFAEVANIKQLDVIDLPTGHWPMWSRARDLAEVIQSAASQTN